MFEISLRHRIGERALTFDFASDAPLVALVGPSGAGKTTVLNAVAGLVRPDEGRIAVAGELLFDSAAGVDLPPEWRRVGYVFQDMRLFPHLSVAANLAYGATAEAPTGWPDGAALVDFLGLGDLLERAPANLSGGEARRVAIGRALNRAPRVLLLDEPFASLDTARAEAMRGLVERIRDELDVPVLLVSHDRAEVDRLAGAVVELAF